MLLNYNFDLRSISSVVFDTENRIGTLADLKQCIVDCNLKAWVDLFHFFKTFSTLE